MFFAQPPLVKISAEINWSAVLILPDTGEVLRKKACRALLGLGGRGRPPLH